jgi:hypothetical protein
MTKLTKPVSRQTAKSVRGRAVIVTVAPCGSQSEARVGFRLAGERLQYVALVSDLYRVAAMWHGQKEALARRVARRDGVPWRVAKRAFVAANSI